MSLMTRTAGGASGADERWRSIRINRQRASVVASLLFFSVVALFLLRGWSLRDHDLIDAEYGIGYLLGIVGGTMMLLLLLYPLRKRIVGLSFLGPIKHIFRLHMIFGVLGPVLILFHANFQWGALNSNIALICMLTVAGSGLLGRYFYSRIHNGLYGSQLTVQQLQDESRWCQGELMKGSYHPQLEPHLRAYEEAAREASRGWLSPVKIPLFTIKAQIFHWRLLRAIKRAIALEAGEERGMRQRQLLLHTRFCLAEYFGAVRRIAEFSFYQRMFSLWHVLHLPLFILMIITGIIHVIAVHMY